MREVVPRIIAEFISLIRRQVTLSGVSASRSEIDGTQSVPFAFLHPSVEQDVQSLQAYIAMDGLFEAGGELRECNCMLHHKPKVVLRLMMSLAL